MKACIIGNSHIAALVSAWPLVRKQYPWFQPTFFASRGNGLLKTRLVDGTIHATDPIVERNLTASGGASSIDLAAFDMVVLVGLETGTTALVRRLAQCDVMDGFDNGMPLVSSAFLADATRTELLGSAARHLANLVAPSGRPLHLVPEPNLSDAILDDGFPFLASPRADLPADLLARLHRNQLEAVFADIAGIQEIPAPSRYNGLLTQHRFTTDASQQIKLTRGLKGRFSQATDHRHMNRDYGLLVWEQLLNRIGLTRSPVARARDWLAGTISKRLTLKRRRRGF